jgi:hypothetical protein
MQGAVVYSGSVCLDMFSPVRHRFDVAVEHTGIIHIVPVVEELVDAFKAWEQTRPPRLSIFVQEIDEG